MKFYRILALIGAAAIFLTPFVFATDQDAVEDMQLATPAQKFSYVLGLDIGQSLKELDTELDLQALMRGLSDRLEATSPVFSSAEIESIKQTAFTRIQEDQAQKRKQQGDVNKAESQSFLEKNKNKEGVVTTASGLQYEVLREGQGDTPKAEDRVTVHYRGTLLDETVFDSSYDRGQPASFSVNQVIPGWTEALQLMNVGSHYRLYIPSELAYRQQGAGPHIGPNAMLIFEVELLEIDK